MQFSDRPATHRETVVRTRLPFSSHRLLAIQRFEISTEDVLTFD
jgi:hypothetical protein